MPTYAAILKIPGEGSIAASGKLSRADMLKQRRAGFGEKVLKRLRQAYEIEICDDRPESLPATASADSGENVVRVRRVPSLGVIFAAGTSELTDKLNDDPEVETVVNADEPIFGIPQPQSSNSGSGGTPWHIQSVEAHLAHANGSKGTGVWIGIADTGIDAQHAEFSGKTIHFADFTGGSVNLNLAAFDPDAAGHGTHVAGIAIGKSVGIAPDAELIVARVLPNSSGGKANFQEVINGLDWLVNFKRPDGETGADVLNLSFCYIDWAGKPVYSSLFKNIIQIIRGLDIEVVAAIGNAGPNTHGSPGNYSDVLAIGAVDQRDNIWPSSSCGTVTPEGNIGKPDFVAPGVDVYSSLPNGQYGTKTGTSMATPVATGVVALLYPSIKGNVAIKRELQSRAVQITSPTSGSTYFRIKF
jgi:subtilisin family serine protease